MQKKEHTVWYEKWRPKTLEEYISTDELKKRIQECIDKNDIPHFVFHGPAGTGKTSLAKLIINSLNCDYIYINASDENGIETIREKVKAFASTKSFQPLKVVILDEADRLTAQAQDALRAVIDEYTLNTRFILTGNNFQRITAPLKSRCEEVKIVIPTKKAMAHRAVEILDKEGVTYQIEDVAKIINPLYPDFRSVLKTIQKNVVNNNLTVTDIVKTSYDQILDVLKTPAKKSWYDIRQIIADSEEDDYTPLYQYLFENVDKFAKGNEAQAVIIIDEYLWRAMVVPDKEINCMAMFAKLLENL
jgi:replication factor C small subunit